MCDHCYAVGGKNRLPYRGCAPTAWLFLMVPLNSIAPFTDMLAQAVECPLLGVADIRDHFFNRFFRTKNFCPTPCFLNQGKLFQDRHSLQRLRVDQDEGHNAGLVRAVGPGMVGPPLDQDVAGRHP